MPWRWRGLCERVGNKASSADGGPHSDSDWGDRFQRCGRIVVWGDLVTPSILAHYAQQLRFGFRGCVFAPQAQRMVLKFVLQVNICFGCAEALFLSRHFTIHIGAEFKRILNRLNLGNQTR